MKHVVITGGTRGIGFGMAREFLSRGHRVTVCGRSEAGTGRAAALLAAECGGERLAALPCDVGDYEQVRALWEEAVKRGGAVDVWINNAGLPNPSRGLWELGSGVFEEVVRTNVLGVMHGSKVAMRGMLEQGHGQIYNMEGLGSDGMVRPGAVVYGATKSAVTYLTRGLVKEAKRTPVRVGFLSPGIVATDLISEEDRESARRVLNSLADRVETVAPFLVEHPRQRPPRRAHRLAAETQARLAPGEDPGHQTRSFRPRGQPVKGDRGGLRRPHRANRPMG